VPEPSTWAMMLAGFAALGYVGYRAAHRRRVSHGLSLDERLSSTKPHGTSLAAFQQRGWPASG
jgi:hypothetical protein